MATMDHLLRLRRTDHKSEHFLVNVAWKGPKQLDLDLVGTDRDSLYRVSMKESGIKNLQAINFDGDLQDWKSTLGYVLLHQQSDGPRPERLKGTEVVATITGTTATLTIRKNIGGITQKLGSIKLEEVEGLEVNLIDWADSAVAVSNDLRVRLEELQDALSSQQQEVARLTSELDQLVKAKKEHESQLLGKCAALLNAKKLKIRNQQRILSGAKVQPDSAADDSRVRTSRSGKRKAASDIIGPEEEEEDGDDEDREMDSGDEDAEERRRQYTPETDEEDVTEDDATNSTSDQQPAPNESQTTGRSNARQSRPPTQMDIDEDTQSSKRRALPTRTGRATAEGTSPPAANDNDDDDDSTEDEL